MSRARRVLHARAFHARAVHARAVRVRRTGRFLHYGLVRGPLRPVDRRGHTRLSAAGPPLRRALTHLPQRAATRPESWTDVRRCRPPNMTFIINIFNGTLGRLQYHHLRDYQIPFPIEQHRVNRAEKHLSVKGPYPQTLCCAHDGRAAFSSERNRRTCRTMPCRPRTKPHRGITSNARQKT